MERQYAVLKKTQNNLLQEGIIKVNGKTIFLHDDISWGEDWEKDFFSCDLVVFWWMGSGNDTEFLKKAASFLEQKAIRHVMLSTDPSVEDILCRVTSQECETMRNYLLYGGVENYSNFWLWMSCQYCQETVDYQEPKALLWNGIFHPQAEKAFTDNREYRQLFCQPDRPNIGIIFQRDEWVWGDLTYQKALIEEIERQGMNAIAVFTNGLPNPEFNAPGIDETVRTCFYDKGIPIIDALISTMKFSLTVSGEIDQKFLQKLGIPFLQAYTLLRSTEEWQECIEGMTAMEMAVSVTMPEFDGVIHAVPVAGKEYLPDGSTQYTPIPERISMLVRKAGKWAQLRRKANKEKKIGIIFHNYPPTNSNIGSAAGMDSPASIRLLLQQMVERGYQIEHIPADSQILMDELIAQVTNDRRFLTDEQIKGAIGKVSAEEYKKWFAGLENENQEQLTRDWGLPPGEVFHYENNLLVPGMLNGNVFITVQPPRGFGEDAAKVYHSPDCAPTHHYLAYYHWLRDIWQADAVIHVGTHGSLEWLPGKGAGLSRKCYSDLAIGDLPNIYPYWITVVGEGVQAKRRGSACLISYLTPPMSHAGTYDELAELEKLMDEYFHFKQGQPGNIEAIIKLIREKAIAANLQDDIPENEEQPFDDYIQRLHVYITDIKNMQIRVGLHVLGCPPQDECLVEYLMALTRMENGDIPSLWQTIAAFYGYDYYDLLEQSGKLLPDGSKTLGALADNVRSHCQELIMFLAKDNFSLEKTEEIYNLPWVQQARKPLQKQLLRVMEYICKKLAPNLQKTEQEISNMLAALEGQYVEPSPAGAPTSGMADVLPTGRNFYGVDPRTLPTSAAWEIGKTMGDDVINRYIAEEGGYPESVGIVVWSTSNMRSHGQCIAQFLYLLGVRPVWQKGSQRVVDLEVISLEELKRPRIDVTARISGLFRDTMPMAIKWMDKAVEMVVNLEESLEDNYVRKHALQDAKELTEQGLDSVQAWEQACYRIFGDPPGTYGAGVGDVLEGKNWETIDDLAKVYVRWGGHVYSNKVSGVFMPELFSRRLSKMNVTIQNEDNREISMLNSDDYNAYHGGMIASVRSLKGEAPRSYCGDSSDRQKVIMRSVQEEIKRLFRGEVMNPKFIEGMKKHGYKGAADLAGYVAHCYEWDATSDVMEDWMYEGLAQKYALDEEMRQWMQQVNPWALQRITEKLLEAEQRGLWQANDKTKQELKQLYLSIEGEMEERSER